jgi:DNA topoisomerase I
MMYKNLVIVESPAKAKTIEKFLGKDFKVLSSFGHIRDLSKKDFGIDMSNNFRPFYEISPDKKKLVGELKNSAKEAETIWLASDEDREGEAIAWHLSEVLGLDSSAKRIVFHEITKEAILHAIENPRSIDLNLVDAQQARRVLDRIVGFELSPVLWKRIKPSLSAGRVQSVAVRLIVDREREIQNFQSDAFYKVSANFLVQDASGNTTAVKADLQQRFNNKSEALTFLEKLKEASFSIDDITTRPGKKSPAAPFTTSTLQQEASRKLGFSVSQTMMIAQRLYESGKITYMRTDSVNLSSLAINTTKAEIESLAGKEYVKIRHYHTKSKGAQEAHEAIRPTYMNVRQIEGTSQEKRLYELIWKRTIASQMADAELEKTTIQIGLSNTSEKFEIVGEVLRFEGFLKVYLESQDEDNENENGGDGILPSIHTEDSLSLESASATERFTQRPFRYTEASLVRKLEELGIGRPSTYAPTISTIQQRQYVVKEDREGQIRPYTVLELKEGQITDTTNTETTGNERSKLFPTDIGMVVNDFLTECFPDIMDFNFTASVEKEFDRIAEGESQWENVINGFYKTFHPAVENASTYSKQKVGERILGEDTASGKPVSVRIGRFGPVVQIGTADDEEKPRFASLRSNQRMDSITLEEALDLFNLPRKPGSFEEKDVTVAIGRFGPYIRHDNKFVSIPKTLDPLSITLEECIQLIESKREADSKKLIKTFEGEITIQILNGRFGPYILKEGNNYRIPKTTDPNTLTLDDCLKLIKDQGEKPAKKAAQKKKATVKKKTTTKKASGTKKAPK